MNAETNTFRTFEDLEVTLKQQAWRVYKLINGYIRYLRERKAGASLALHESSPAYGLTEDELDKILSDSPI